MKLCTFRQFEEYHEGTVKPFLNPPCLDKTVKKFKTSPRILVHLIRLDTSMKSMCSHKTSMNWKDIVLQASYNLHKRRYHSNKYWNNKLWWIVNMDYFFRKSPCSFIFIAEEQVERPLWIIKEWNKWDMEVWKIIGVLQVRLCQGR